MNRRGGALLLALLILVLLGGLASLALAAGRLRARSGDRTLAQARARATALSGLAEREAHWDPAFAQALPVGGADALPGTPVLTDGLQRTDSLLRLGASLYLLRTIGELRDGSGNLLAREGLGRLLRLEAPGIPDSAAAFVRGPVMLLADSSLSGSDQVPAGWSASCPPPDSGASALHLGTIPAVTPVVSCPSGRCLVGAPMVVPDSTLSLGFLDRLPVSGFTALAAAADHQVTVPVLTPGPVTTLGTCNATRADNWGDPAVLAAPCGPHRPLLVVGNPFRMQDGLGQGILLAPGDLEFAGAAHFVGVVLAAGQVSLRDQALVEGVVLAEGGLQVEDLARLRRSTCAVRHALLGARRPLRPVPRGFWRWP
ncbi:MAG: hypothetical protein IPK12_02175 [Gemmatimonadetes bacterium]|nr:hypothetical protein [Gemmatimonadota bacterium]